MKKLLSIIIITLLLQTNSFVQASIGRTNKAEVPQRKPLIFSTLLVNKGKPDGMIATPNIPAFKALAARVQQAIKKATGATLQVIDVDKIANVRGEFTGAAPGKPIITLGSLQNNGLIAHLYFRGYCSVDANYPGATGYVVQTVCDPWAAGANVIVLGGSNNNGVIKAVNRFCADLPKGATLNLPRTLKAVVNPNYNAGDPGDAQRAKILEQAAIDFKAGKHNGLFIPIVKAATAYKQTGKEGQAKLFRDLLFLEYDLKTHSPNDFDSPWGGGADMQSAPFITAWDNVEESPSLSDADRQKIMSIMLEYLHYYEKYSYIPYYKTKGIRHNHHTFPGQGFAAAGRYFTKYYPTLPDGTKWQQMGDDCFKVQETSWKTMENSSAYVGLTTRHMCFYATTRPDFTWFDSGRANIAGNLVIMTMDNLGSQCAFGDMEGYNPRSSMDLWTNLVTVERNGRYAWAIHKGRDSFRHSSHESDSIPVYVQPVVPKDMLGTKYFPVDSLFYATLNGKGKVPLSQTFDKLSFRSSFDPQKQYLAIDGINTGYHSHRDGNAVLRLTDHGRIWLADGDYIKASAKYHNTLLIFRDGEAAPQPPFIKKDFIADLPSVGISRTTMPDYSGTDWTRNIIWDKEKAFVFIDEVKANSNQSYSVRALWHTLGEPELKGNNFYLSQQGQSFDIQNLDGSQLRYLKDYEVGKNWVEYKYAKPIVNSLQQIHNVTLRKGDKTYVLNVMSAQTGDSKPIVSARVNDSTLILGSGKEQALIGVGEIKTKGIGANTSVYWLTRGHIALVGATALTLSGKKIFRSTEPLSAEVSGTSITLDADRAIPITFYAPKSGILLDNAPVKASGNGMAFTIKLPAGKHRITGIAIPKQFAVQFPATAKAESNIKVELGNGKLIAQAQFTLEKGAGTRPFDADKNGAYITGNNGVLYALTPDLKSRWTYPIGGDIRAVWTGKLEKNAPARIVAGNDAGRVVVLDQDGKLLWEKQIPLFWHTRQVNCFASADLKGDGNHALIVGSENWHTYAYDAAGNLIWNYMCTRGATAGAGFDINGDGKEELILGTEYYTWGAVNSDNGQALWTIRGGPGANDVAGADMDGKGKRMVFMAGADGYLYAMNPNGKISWTYSTGDGATCIQVMDVNNDGEQEVLTGSLSGDVVALNADGKRVWRRDIGEPVLSMVKADVDGDGRPDIVIGTADGHVIMLNADGRAVAHWTAAGAINKLVVLGNRQIAAGAEGGKLAILSMQ